MGGMDGPYTPSQAHDGRHTVSDEKGRSVVVLETARAAQDLAAAMNIGAFEIQARQLHAIRSMGR